jgi:Mrp family chromosome partitioning ATPase
LDLLATSAFGALVANAREHYDEIIIDTPPVEVVSDACLMAGHVHRAVLVVRLHRSRQRAVGRAIEQLAAVGVRTVGLVLNSLSPMDAGYGYGYRYGNGYGADAEAGKPSQAPL